MNRLGSIKSLEADMDHKGLFKKIVIKYENVFKFDKNVGNYIKLGAC